jgi:phosphocarrier protein
MQTCVVAITNPLGLHARACARVVHIASRFRSNVSLVVKGKRASARNIVAVMLLTASVGTTVRLEIDGPDEGDSRNRRPLSRWIGRTLVARSRAAGAR